MEILAGILLSTILVNNFVLQTTRFLNRFSNTCEEKLSEVSSGIQSLEISLSIIEAKLKIKGLEAAPAGAPAAAPAAAAAPTMAREPYPPPDQRLRRRLPLPQRRDAAVEQPAGE